MRTKKDRRARRAKIVKQRFQPHPTKRPKGEPRPPGRILWSFAKFDRYSWGESTGVHKPFVDIADRLKNYESMSWNEIATGARDHAVRVGKLSRKAQTRLREVKQDDVDELFRLRFDSTSRLWGIRSGDTFEVLWWDPDHMVCPSGAP